MSVWSLSGARRASAMIMLSSSLVARPEVQPLGRVSKGEIKSGLIGQGGAGRLLTIRAGLVGATARKAKTESIRPGGALLHFRQARGVARHQVNLDIDLA